MVTRTRRKSQLNGQRTIGRFRSRNKRLLCDIHLHNCTKKKKKRIFGRLKNIQNFRAELNEQIHVHNSNNTRNFYEKILTTLVHR